MASYGFGQLRVRTVTLHALHEDRIDPKYRDWMETVHGDCARGLRMQTGYHVEVWWPGLGDWIRRLSRGDFCFSNILYDVKSGIIRLIDPRGKWADNSFGDIKYDIAKLRHSIVGQYDFIVNNLFSVKIKDTNIKYKIFNNKKYLFCSDYFDQKIKEHWSLDNIKFIEGLLFLSMLPLHNDYFDRQLVMYAIGIQRINEVLNNKNRIL